MRKTTMVLLLVMFVAVSCSHKSSPSASGPVQTLASGRTETGVPGPLPVRATSSKDVDKNVSSGEEVFITSDGFVPALLYAKIGAELRFINETDIVQQITFVSLPWTSKKIAPGSYASYTPHEGGSVLYELAGDKKIKGNLDISAYYEPGETSNP